MMANKLLIGALFVGFALFFASCGKSSGSVTVSKADIEGQARQTIADDVKKDIAAIPKVYCPRGLSGKVGTKLSCTMARDSSGRRFQVNLKVVKVSGDKVDFSLTTQPIS